jgi:3-oxoacyl-[acyl-carrier protein] reductase
LVNWALVSGRVLVTGASAGIGRAIALRLARKGWKVIFHYHKNHSSAEEAVKEVGGELPPFGADLSREEEARRLWEWAVQEGPVEALVNNAGVYRPLPFTTEEEGEFFANWSLHYETNFLSTLRLTRWFVLHRLQQANPSGRIVVISSRVGFKGEGGASAYAASKAAQINLVRSLAVELAPYGIRIYGVAPGWVDTAMARPGMKERLPEILQGIPLGRVATPEDVAGVVAFLLSEEADYLSGQVIDVNGASYFH